MDILITVGGIICLLGFGIGLIAFCDKMFDADGWLNLYVLYSKDDRKLLRIIAGAEYDEGDDRIPRFINPSRPDLCIFLIRKKLSDHIICRKGDDELGLVLEPSNWKPYHVAYAILENKIEKEQRLRLMEKRKFERNSIQNQISKVIE